MRYSSRTVSHSTFCPICRKRTLCVEEKGKFEKDILLSDLCCSDICQEIYKTRLIEEMDKFGSLIDCETVVQILRLGIRPV